MTRKIIALSCTFALHVWAFGANRGETPKDATDTNPPQQSRLITGKVDKVLYTSNKDDSSTLTFEYAYFKPERDGGALERYQVVFNELVYENALWETLSDIDEERITASFTSDFFAERLDSVAAIHRSEQIEFGFDQLWFLSTETEVYDFKSHIALTLSNYSFTGGAHGGSNITHYLIDRATGRLLKLSDFFADFEGLNAVAETYFRAHFNMEDEDDFSNHDFWFPNDVFSVNENFTFRENSIVFHFNEYEIAPYCYGRTELVIPLAELEPFLTDAGKKRL